MRCYIFIMTGFCSSLFAVLLCATISLRAQVPLMQWHTIDDGLPSSQVYQILQDQNGFIWCSTGNGIARFDGTTFVSFTSAQGFPDRGAYHMLLDHRGRIWFLTFSGKTCYYENGTFHLPDLPLVKNDFVRWIEEMHDGRLLFLTNKGIVIMQWPDGRFRNYTVASESLFHGQLLGNDSLIIASNTYSCLHLPTGKITQLDIPLQMSRRFIRVLPLSSRKLVLTADKGVYLYEHNNLSFIPLSNEIMPEQVCALENDNGDVWIGTYGGAFRFAGGKIDKQNMECVLPGHGVTSIIKDHEGNLWFSIFNEGICMLPRQFTSVYNRENGLLPDRNILRIAKGNDNRVYAFATTGQFFRLDSTSAVLAGKLPLTAPTTEVLTVFASEKDVLVSNGNIFCRLRNGKISASDQRMQMLFQFCVYSYASPGNWIYPNVLKSELQICEYNDRTGQSVIRWQKDVGALGEAINSTFLLPGEKPGSYWLGTRQGPFYLGQGGSIWNVAETETLLRTTVTSIAYDLTGKIWIGTATSGVFCFDEKKMIAHYNMNEGLPGNYCNMLYADNVQGMWICTNRGLAWIRPGHNNPLTVYRSPEILPGHEALSMCKTGQRVYVATTKGIGSFMDNVEQYPDVFPPVYINSISIDGQNKNASATYDLEPGQNNVELGFAAITFRKGGTMRYRYRLEGADTGWSYTTSDHIQYRSLPPGHYTFRVFALSAAGLTSKIPAVIAFTIPPAWWQTWWFRLSAIIVLISTLFFIAYIRIRAMRKAAFVRQQLLETRLQALRAQINPHFVFNALNSVQSFIFSQQPEQANEYLVSFARMMRMISEGAEKETILLREEIAFLHYYIGMEKLRFNDDFQYSIVTDNYIDEESVRIPPMILQPVIENAIKHGLSSKEGEKRLRIHFSSHEPNVLNVRVEDNGTGRKEHRAEKVLGKTQLGIANVRQRLMLLQKRSKKIDPVLITDLYDNGNPAGVRVDLVIELPEINKK